MNPANRRGHRGFSLVETLIVVAIIGAALLIGIPAMGTFLRRGRVDSSARQVDMSLLTARMQAVKRGNDIGVVFSNDPARISDPTDPIGYASPAIFIDVNTNGAFDAGTDTVIQRLPLPGYTGIHFGIDDVDKASGDPSTTAATVAYVFTPFGSELAASSGSGKGIYVFDEYSNVLQVSVPVVASGRVTMTKRLVAGGTNTYVVSPWKWY